MIKLRLAVVGAGAFGKHHVRAISQLPDVELAAIVDLDLEKAQALATEHGCAAFAEISDLSQIDAAIVATPTVTHEEIATRLIEAGVDVLVEKPIADSSLAGERLARLAEERGRVLQVGHLERFNPAVTALERILTVPLFFEVHRLSVFTPRSLDVDVVFDLMIHDLDIVLSFVGAMPEEIRAAGISVLSKRVDIANVRLSFASGCVANLTASRISTERVRKLRLFQPGEYISLDYHRQDLTRLQVLQNEAKPKDGFVFSNPQPQMPQIGFVSQKIEHAEPLTLELKAFVASVRERTKPKVDGFQAAKALRVAEGILAKIKEHMELVAGTLSRRV